MSRSTMRDLADHGLVDVYKLRKISTGEWATAKPRRMWASNGGKTWNKIHHLLAHVVRFSWARWAQQQQQYDLADLEIVTFSLTPGPSTPISHYLRRVNDKRIIPA